MSSPKLTLFWKSLLGEHECYRNKSERVAYNDVERGVSCLRVYRNNDGTWALMPNWFNTAEQNHKRGTAITYETFENIPEAIQTKLSVLLLTDSGGEWLTGIGKRIDDGVFWLEDGD